jgi:hypothetical protein
MTQTLKAIEFTKFQPFGGSATRLNEASYHCVRISVISWDAHCFIGIVLEQRAGDLIDKSV